MCEQFFSLLFINSIRVCFKIRQNIERFSVASRYSTLPVQFFLSSSDFRKTFTNFFNMKFLICLFVAVCLHQVNCGVSEYKVTIIYYEI